MKNPEEYIIEQHGCIWMPTNEEVFRQSDIIEYIKLAQKEAYNQAVQDAADNLTKTCSEFSDLRWDDNDIYKKSTLKLKIK